MVFCCLPAPRPLSSPSRSAPAGRDPPIRPPRGPAFRLKAGEGLPPKTGEDCGPLKAACRQGAGRAAPGSPLPAPAPRAPRPCPAPRAKLTSRPRVRPNHTPRARPEPAPLGLGPGTAAGRKPSPPTSPHRPLPPPLSPPRTPEQRREGAAGGACLAPAPRNERNGRGARSPQLSRRFCAR